ncbi:MAG: hypothetical protein BGO31_05605 [Bacteroidetes bacterium 43-16]|nr:MAG: hypothetical protein BGO31_05605 [Bacteroidetes bacterium 43-16]
MKYIFIFEILKQPKTIFMKRVILLWLNLMPVLIFGQSTLPEPVPESPSNSGFYYENQGQVTDHLGTVRPDVLYYTERTYPSVYLMKDKVAFWDMVQGDTSVAAPDTLRRIDMQFICDKQGGGRASGGMMPPCATLQEYEISQDHLNYYLPHCGTGITDVKGYARIVYENVFPDIDVHLYSNAYGPKMYFVIRPGGNAADIQLKFEGQDSIAAISSVLKMFLGSWRMSLPLAYAYEIDSSNTSTLLGWQAIWQHSGGGYVNILPGSYDTSNTLVIAVGAGGGTPLSQQNLDWSVYYGAAGEQRDGQIDADDNSVYHGMTEHGNDFPAQIGQSYPQQTGIAFTGDWCLSRFSNTVRRWCTYYGGSSVDKLTALKVYKGTDAEVVRTGDLWVAGTTISPDVFEVPVPPAFF